ncbi:uncharacterized protein FOMMEDRAFT_153856 [Fomitiporia mediterranea MF3/22]|uniref:uncharacterized protein n=1 Tax=Fomitiporia mediterranea (strain MF3/22) TaxID=694068 RepID=UPI0004408294|nr:uncharacterized protein FOMMEDRAFT_153856 [Fomitiporia mediterranea MF3/22]EJD04766.1 hypothetical protein FOMMEDRAFT_153856 [Fomitiporia mediterranea MF3/22]
MPFNVATIKDKAVSAKNATVTKVQNTRDRHSSMPMAKTRFAEAGYVPDARKAPPPPPPPMRSHVSGQRFGRTSGDGTEDVGATESAPPPVVRNTKPVMNTNTLSSPSESSLPPALDRTQSVLERAKAFGAEARPAISSQPQSWKRSRPTPKADVSTEIASIDWANLSPTDKQVFFEWLDEFFARYLQRAAEVTSPGKTEKKEVGRVGEHVEPPPAPPVSKATVVSGAKLGPPPTIRSWSKPSIDTVSQSQSEFTPSYPPSTVHGSQALDLADYFHPSTQWDTAWYAGPNAIPPPLQTNLYRLYKAQMVSRGDTKSIQFAILFNDLSAAWVSVSFSVSTSRVTERSAKYLPVPPALPQELLVQANEMYGESIASYAESYLGSGQFCARGECWDLANEALKFFASDPSIPPPVPSLGRTHGHLIFAGRAYPGGIQVGRWRGGDDRIRRGDIVEWRSVRRIGIVGGPPGAYGMLGDPEHTAVISRDATPSPSAHLYDGASIEPRVFRELEVVEQSRNFNPPEPVKKCYDLERFEEGEVWIYRPISLEVYLGFGELECEAPLTALSI